MFGTIKSYFLIIKGAVLIGILAYMKYLKTTNEEQKQNIDRLKEEIKVRKEVAKDEKKKAIFDAKQKARAEALKDSEITLDEIEREVQSEKNINDDIHSFDRVRV